MIETAFKQDELESILSSGLSKVVFYKVDGTIRELVGTRDPSLIPDDQQITGKGKRVKCATTVCVYDVEEDGWRSFLIENLISIEHAEGEIVWE